MACLLVILTGCRKEGDTTGPRVEILAPINGFQMAIPGALTVRATVSDDREVRSVTISLLDADGVPATSPSLVQVGGNSATIERSLGLFDERLRSGAYTLVVRASDGTNEGRAFRTIHVQEAPLRLRALFAVGHSGQQVIITRIDSLFQASPWGSMAQDLSGAVISSDPERLIVCGSINGPMTAYDPLTSNALWQVPNVNITNVPFFNGLYRGPDGRCYHGTNTGRVRAVSIPSGSITMDAAALPDHRAYLHHVQGIHLLSEQRPIAGQQARLVRYIATNGTLAENQPLDKELVAMHARGNTHALLFGNRDADGVIEDRNIEQGGSWEPKVFATDPIRHVARADEGIYFLALNSGIRRYTWANNSDVVLNGAVVADALRFDPATGMLFAAEGNTVLAMDPWNGTILASVPLPSSVQYLLPLYNREP